IELLATKSNDEETLFLTVLNKNVEGKAYDLSILLQDVSHPAGEIKIRKLSATDIPTAYALSEYASPEIKHTIPALSIVNFEITPGKYSSALKTNAGITKLKACPNPVSNRTVLSAYLPQASDVEIAIFDVEGRMIEQRKYNHCAAGEFEKEFRFEKYAKGIYIIRLSSQNSSEQALLVKR
ncbi:MAG: T9SS type A sorting domain-containing protein, partial [Dysgonamonadaceae bacterium]|nr:T9SS type A sorting domain-containing protein [Dysgonamonadaceae bacterium]